MTVGLVIVSHSEKLADGVAELAGQMAPDVSIQPAGGIGDGELGTDFDAVRLALRMADRGAGVVLLYDLGSAQMTAELAVEAADEPSQARVVDAPLVEGAVAAAVAAQGGADLDAVVAAAESAGGLPLPDEPAPDVTVPEAPAHRTDMLLTNEVGLHARPAALLARRIADLDAEVTVSMGEHSADARSVLALLALSARYGDRIEVVARGQDAAEAIRRIEKLAADKFDE